MNYEISSNNKIKDKFIIFLYALIILKGLFFIVKQLGVIISSGEIGAAVQKLVWAFFLVGIVVVCFGLRRKKLLKNLYIISGGVLILYSIFTFNRISVRCNDLLFVDDFVKESREWNRENDEVYRIQNEGVFGSMNKLVYVGREKSITPHIRFEYTVYNVKIELFRDKIISQYADMLDDAEITNINNTTIYEINCEREKEYITDTTDYFPKEQKYEHLFIIKDEEKIVEFYYRDFENLSQDDVLDIVVEKVF